MYVEGSTLEIFSVQRYDTLRRQNIPAFDAF